jgi:hypothetical protein
MDFQNRQASPGGSFVGESYFLTAGCAAAISCSDKNNK